MKHLIDKFLTYQLSQCHSDGTVEWYRGQLYRYDSWLGSRRFDDPDTIAAYLASSRQSGNESSTVEGHYRALRSWFNWLHRRQLVTDNPMTAIDRPKVSKKEPKRAELDEYQLLMDLIGHASWVDARDRLIVSLLFLCGLRRAECANLAQADFRTKEHLLLVRDGKGGRDRLIPLPPAVNRAFVEYIFCRPMANTSAFFIASTGLGYPKPAAILPGAIYQMLRRRCQRVGLRMLNPHSFRHGLAMYLLNEGGDMSLVQRILGHSQIATTARYYAEWLTAGIQREYAERMRGVGE